MRSCAATSLLHLEFSILYLHWPLSNFRNIKSIESLSKAKETNLSQLWCEIVNSASFIPFINPSRFWLPWLTYFHVKVLGNFQYLIFILVRYVMLLTIKANTCNFAHIIVETVIRGLCFVLRAQSTIAWSWFYKDAFYFLDSFCVFLPGRVAHRSLVLRQEARRKK